MRVLATTWSVIAFAVSTPAMAQFVNGYAVSNHRPCGVGNLPATTPELEKFFSSPDFPEDLRKNVLWKDGQVKVNDWRAESDHFESTKTVNGQDGVDASLISYIASHGVTSNGKYTAYAGGDGAGCQIQSSNMGMGDQNARYLILSTCQGLKIGTGDDPARAGENPSRTWTPANRGLNCILGYSNNMDDSQGYGVNLLRQLATTDASLSAAFFKSSRMVSYRNVPAMLCFGVDDEAARNNLTSARRFVEERYGQGGSAWSYEKTRVLAEAKARDTKQPTARRLAVRPRAYGAESYARSLIAGGHEDVERAFNAQLEVYRTAAGTVTRDLRTGVLDWTRSSPEPYAAYKLSDEASVRVAAQFLATRRFITKGEAWVATHIVDRGIGHADGSMVVGKTVVFHENLGGLRALGSVGSIEVSLDAAGEPSRATVHGVEVAAMAEAGDVDWASHDVREAESRALAELTEREPGAALKVLDTRLGYDFGDPLVTPTAAVASVEVTVEVRTGDVARNMVVRYAL